MNRKLRVANSQVKLYGYIVVGTMQELGLGREALLRVNSKALRQLEKDLENETAAGENVKSIIKWAHENSRA